MNGVLTRIFPALKHGLRVKLRNMPPIIVSCITRYIIIRSVGDDDPPEDVELEAFELHQQWNGYENVPVDPPLFNHQPGAFGVRQGLIDEYFA